MIDFKKRYDRDAFLDFLQNQLLPDDFEIEETLLSTDRKVQKISKITRLGSVKSLGKDASNPLKVYEIEHNSENDPRVSLTKEAFSLLSDDHASRSLVIFKSSNSDNFRFSLMTIDLVGAGKQVKKESSNPKRLSYFLGHGAKTNTPTKFLVTKGQVATFEDLRSRFSVEVVNREFYNEVAKHYVQLVGDDKTKSLMHLPSMTNSQKEYQEFAVRLIGRLVFCWFLKQKKSDKGQLIPDELLSSTVIKDSKDYYHEILEPLFFEILNKPMDSERLPKYDIGLWRKIPYLNGGLFAPQDEDFYSLDSLGFSKQLNILKIPNAWFSSFFTLLETYNFTIDENSSVDSDLSVDPEMLGRIFENLLAELNPETGESARKSTGSFYTPREIVDFMVDESLSHYLVAKTKLSQDKIDAVLSYDMDDDKKNPLTEHEKEIVVSALDELTVLDPACGSGAYPMGILHKVLMILQRIDEDGSLWFGKKISKVNNTLIKNAIEDSFKNQKIDYLRKLGIIKDSIFGVDIQPIAVEVSRLRCFLTLVVEEDINDDLDNRGIKPLPNLDFKFVAANTLIKVPKETGQMLFVDEFQGQLAQAVDTYFQPRSSQEKNNAQTKIHQLISEKVREKTKTATSYLGNFSDDRLNKELANRKSKIISSSLAEAELWESYRNIFTHKTVGFFETNYFFPGVKDGFDIVIGNPPYIQLQKNRGELANIYQDQGYQTFERTGDIYSLFYERGLELSKKESGILCYITSNKWMRAGYGESLREFFSQKNPRLLVDFAGFKVFESATVDTNILLVQNVNSSNKTSAVHFKNDYKKGSDMNDYVVDNMVEVPLTSGTVYVGTKDEFCLKEKIERLGTPLKEWDININYGIKTGLNEAFIIDDKTKKIILSSDPNCGDVIVPVLGGSDLGRYYHNEISSYLLNVHNGYMAIDGSRLEPLDINSYPEIKSYLDKYKDKLFKRSDHGKTAYNLRNCAYLNEFQKEKIVWLNLNRKWKYSYVEPGIFVEASLNFISTNKNSKYLVGLLSSKLHLWYFRATGRLHDDGGYMCKIDSISNFPAIKVDMNNELVGDIEKLVTEKINLIKAGKDEHKIDAQIDTLVYKLYEVTADEIKIIENVPTGLTIESPSTIKTDNKPSEECEIEAVVKTINERVRDGKGPDIEKLLANMKKNRGEE